MSTCSARAATIAVKNEIIAIFFDFALATDNNDFGRLILVFAFLYENFSVDSICAFSPGF